MKSILLVVPDRTQQAETIAQWGVANWSAAFVAVLEKRGWLSVDVRTLTDLKGAADISTYDLAIVAWHGDGGPTEEQARWLAAAGRPILIEGPASAALLRAFGLASGGEPVRLNGSPRLELIDAKLRSDLGRRSPAVMGANPQHLTLDDKALTTREMEFDFIGARFKAMAASRSAESAAAMLISVLQVFKRRFERNGFLFEDIGFDLWMALSLQLVATKLSHGRYEDQFQGFIRQAIQATLRRYATCNVSQEQRQKLDLIRGQLDGSENRRLLFDDANAQRNAKRILRQVEQDPRAELDTILLSAFPRINIATLLLAVAMLPEQGADEIRERMFRHLRDRFYKPHLGGFGVAATLDGTFQIGEGIVSHPHIARALAILSGPIEMPHFGDLSRASFTRRQIDAWDQAPLVHQKLIADGWDVIAEFAGSAEPALLQRGRCILTSFPLLAWITYYHTVGPLPDAYDVASSAGFMGAEELLVLCLERLAGHSERPVPRVAPWPWGFDYVLNIRHDVDRIPDPETFERLMQFHQSNRHGVTWCWLPWRLDPQMMSAQRQAGHEIALHAVRSLEKAQELRSVSQAAAGAEVVGEAFHGSAADYWLGALSVQTAIETGLSYTEFALNVFLFPYCAYPWLESDGTVSLRRGATGITESATTDDHQADVRKERLIVNVACVKEWAHRGLAIVLLNHPDMNFDRLQSMVDELPRSGRLNWTARQIADWWQRTHQVDHLSWEWDGNVLVVTSTEDIVDLSMILPATKRVMEVDGDHDPDPRLDHGPGGEVRLRLSLKAGMPVRIL